MTKKTDETQESKTGTPAQERETPQPEVAPAAPVKQTKSSPVNMFGWVGRNSVAAIEACGRHPFATGVFAILGVAGLALSARGFVLDRQESKETTEIIQRIQNDPLKNDVYAWTSLELTNREGTFENKNGVLYCSPPSRMTLDATRDFIDTLMQHVGKTIFVDFTWDVEECRILQKTEDNMLDGKPVVLSLRAGLHDDFATHIYRYNHIGVDAAYIEKAKDIYSPAFTIYFENQYTHKNMVDEYVVSIWPPVSELQTFNHFADEYGLHTVAGLYKVKIPTTSGGIGIELIPVESIDIDKYERTVEAKKEAAK